jgi:hypothetical protein
VVAARNPAIDLINFTIYLAKSVRFNTSPPVFVHTTALLKPHSHMR